MEENGHEKSIELDREENGNNSIEKEYSDKRKVESRLRKHWWERCEKNGTIEGEEVS